MPISEDEIEQRHQINSNNNPTTMSKAELRRSNKPIMEKRRRARINHCLNELKTLILDAMKKDPARHSKLEKADILEMTVKHLQSIQRQQFAVSVATDPSVIHKFKSGFHECAGEVSRFIGSMEGVENGVKQRLVAHLSTCVNGLSQISPFSFTGLNNSNGIATPTFHSTNNNLNIPLQNTNPVPVVLPQVSISSGDVNNNGDNTRIQMPSGIQLIPSRLPTGELALLVPNSSNMPFFPSDVTNATIAQTFPIQQIPPSKPVADSSTKFESTIQLATQSMISTKPHHASAFTTVTRSRSPQELQASPLASPASSTYQNEEIHSVDSFKLKTPSPPILNQAITSTPFTSQSNFKSCNLLQSTIYLGNDSHQDTAQVTSTSSSPESRLDELKIGYQSVPIYQPIEKSKPFTSNKYYDEFSKSNNSSQSPISVIINREKLKNSLQYSTENSIIDSLSRKRSISETEASFAVASEHPSKMRKYSSEIVSSSQSHSESEVSHRASECSDSSTFESTSANTSGSSASTSASNESMWRPW